MKNILALTLLILLLNSFSIHAAEFDHGLNLVSDINELARTHNKDGKRKSGIYQIQRKSSKAKHILRMQRREIENIKAELYHVEKDLRALKLENNKLKKELLLSR